MPELSVVKSEPLGGALRVVRSEPVAKPRPRVSTPPPPSPYVASVESTLPFAWGMPQPQKAAPPPPEKEQPWIGGVSIPGMERLGGVPPPPAPLPAMPGPTAGQRVTRFGRTALENLGEKMREGAQMGVGPGALPVTRIGSDPEIQQQAPKTAAAMDLPHAPFGELVEGEGYAKGAATFAGGLTSTPSMGFIAGGGVLGMFSKAGYPVVQRLVSAGFSVDMLHGAYEQYPEFKEAIDAGDYDRAKTLGTQMGLGGALGLLAAKHAATGKGIPQLERWGRLGDIYKRMGIAEQKAATAPDLLGREAYGIQLQELAKAAKQAEVAPNAGLTGAAAAAKPDATRPLEVQPRPVEVGPQLPKRPTATPPLEPLPKPEPVQATPAEPPATLIPLRDRMPVKPTAKPLKVVKSEPVQPAPVEELPKPSGRPLELTPKGTIDVDLLNFRPGSPAYALVRSRTKLTPDTVQQSLLPEYSMKGDVPTQFYNPSTGAGVSIQGLRSDLMEAAVPGRQNIRFDFFDKSGRSADSPSALQRRILGTTEGSPKPVESAPPKPRTLPEKLEAEALTQRSKEGERGSLSGKPLPPESPRVEWVGEKVEERYQAAEFKEPSVADKLRDAAERGRKLTRTFAELPSGKRFAQLTFDLKQLEKAPSMATHKTLESLIETTKGFDRNHYDSFNKKVVADDLAETLGRYKAEGGKKIQEEMWFGMKESDLVESRKLFDARAEDPVLKKALDQRRATWDKVRSEYKAAMKDAGYPMEDKLTRESYFRHNILEYHTAKSGWGLGTKKLEVPTSREFLRKRTSFKDFAKDYLESEFEVMAQMQVDTAKARMIAKVKKSEHNIGSKMDKELAEHNKQLKEAGDPPMDIADYVKEHGPEGYTTWQPRPGTAFYRASSIPAKVAEQIFETEMGKLVDASMLRTVMAKGGPFKRIVIPKEVAKTLDNLWQEKGGMWEQYGLYEPLLKWKQLQLLSPFREVKYNARNVSGDAEAAFVGNPTGFKKTPQALRDIYRYYFKNKQTSPELQDWFDRGGQQQLLQAQEMGDMRSINELKALFPKKAGVATDAAKSPVTFTKWWFKKARSRADFRESILRYANYLSYLEQMKGDRRPKNWGGSIPEEAMALGNVKDRAFKMSNDLLGAYDEISVAGQRIRRDAIPFWSFQEINFRRYKRFAQNAARDNGLASAMGRKLLGKALFKTPYVTYRVGAFGLKATALSAALWSINNGLNPEAEEALPDDVKWRPHLTFGTSDEGKAQYFGRLGIMSDLVDWFGPEESEPIVRRWLNGHINLSQAAQEIAQETPTAAANKVVQSLTPIWKTPVELFTRQNYFPDFRHPRTIRDRAEHVASTLTARDPYRLLTGKPTRPFASVGDAAGRALKSATIYEIDPGQTAFWSTRDRVHEFEKDVLKKTAATGGYYNPKGVALYNIRTAVKLGDRDAVQKYRAEYKAYLRPGEDLNKNIKRSLESLRPLSGLSRADRKRFIMYLDEEGLEKLTAATQYYNTVLNPKRKAAQPARPGALQPVAATQ